MKQIVSNYSYSPATNVVTLTGVNIDADQLLLIVAPQVGRTLYNFASVTGAVSAGPDTRVTLNASTAGLTTTSPLVIFYDDQASTQTITGTVALDPASLVALENVTVTIGSSVTVGGTVTANVPLVDATLTGGVTQGVPVYLAGGKDGVVIDEINYINFLPAISGTVTANLSNTVTATWKGAIGSSNAVPIVFAQEGQAGGSAISYDGSNTSLNVNVKGSLPAISGTVTANASNGSLTTRFGTPTTANTAFATSAVTNANRKYLLIQNVTTGSNVITVGIGFTPTTTQGIQLTAGAGITFESSYIPTGAVQILSSVTASNFTILEA